MLVKTTPQTAPETVFLGLIFGHNFGPFIFTPHSIAVESLIIGIKKLEINATQPKLPINEFIPDKGNWSILFNNINPKRNVVGYIKVNNVFNDALKLPLILEYLFAFKYLTNSRFLTNKRVINVNKNDIKSSDN